MSAEEKGYWELFWDFMCNYRDLFALGFGLNVGLLALLLLSTVGIRRGTAEFVVWVMALAVVLPTIVITGYAFWKCSKREPTQQW